jgi:hypothetical protein
MKSAAEYEPQQLIGRKVVFKRDDEHADCWHQRVGLQTGVVVKLGQSLAKKAEMLGVNELLPEELVPEEADVPRVWVRADPCGSFPRGCEMSVEMGCLLVVEILL